MKKLIILFLTSFCFASCDLRTLETIRNDYNYDNPRKMGGYFTVIQNGTEINHLKCVYWSTSDDDSIFMADNGKRVFVNGSSLIIEE
jgi:hypothetical protein